MPVTSSLLLHRPITFDRLLVNSEFWRWCDILLRRSDARVCGRVCEPLRLFQKFNQNLFGENSFITLFLIHSLGDNIKYPSKLIHKHATFQSRARKPMSRSFSNASSIIESFVFSFVRCFLWSLSTLGWFENLKAKVSRQLVDMISTSFWINAISAWWKEYF